MTRYRALAALLLTVIFSACEKNAVQDITAPEPGARIKFFNFGVNAPSVNFYAGTAKVTATGSTTGIEATTGVGYGSVSASGFYSAGIIQIAAAIFIAQADFGGDGNRTRHSIAHRFNNGVDAIRCAQQTGATLMGVYGFGGAAKV